MRRDQTCQNSTYIGEGLQDVRATGRGEEQRAAQHMHQLGRRMPADAPVPEWRRGSLHTRPRAGAVAHVCKAVCACSTRPSRPTVSGAHDNRVALTWRRPRPHAAAVPTIRPAAPPSCSLLLLIHNLAGELLGKVACLRSLLLLRRWRGTHTQHLQGGGGRRRQAVNPEHRRARRRPVAIGFSQRCGAAAGKCRARAAAQGGRPSGAALGQGCFHRRAPAAWWCTWFRAPSAQQRRSALRRPARPAPPL